MNGNPLAVRQLYGAIGIVIMVVFVYVARDVLRYMNLPGEGFVSSQWEGIGITVELAGDENHSGIYFLRQGATIRDLLIEAGIDDVAGFRDADLAGVVYSGDRVLCDMDRYRATIGDMFVSTRLALGMPVDLNKATLEELMLIPGIGRRTASKVVRFREEEGAFSEIDVLKRIKSLGKKRYDRIKGYLFINRACCP